MKMDKNLVLTAAMAGLFMASTNTASAADKKVEDTVMCYGVNECGGKGSCHGKVDSCGGKNSCSTEVKCAGHNSCKGKGLVKLTKKECLDKKGTIASAK